MFSKCKAEGYQVCCYCGEFIGKGNIGLSLRKVCQQTFNVWIHLSCIEKFAEDIVNFKKENMKELLLENLK
jgi:hypothetical protein